MVNTTFQYRRTMCADVDANVVSNKNKKCVGPQFRQLSYFYRQIFCCYPFFVRLVFHSAQFCVTRNAEFDWRWRHFVAHCCILIVVFLTCFGFSRNVFRFHTSIRWMNWIIKRNRLTQQQTFRSIADKKNGFLCWRCPAEAVNQNGKILPP